MSQKKLSNFTKTHEVAIVGFFTRENEIHHKVFSEAIWKLHKDSDNNGIGAGVASVTLQSVAKKQKAQVPSVVVYLDGELVEEEGTFRGDKWVVKALLEFLRPF